MITLEEFKNYKGITLPDEDAQIAQYIDYASALIKHICGRTFVDYYDKDKIEEFDADRSVLFLSEIPVKVVSSVILVSEYGDQHLSLNSDYRINNKKGAIYSTSGIFDLSPASYIKVVYRGGYKQIPDDLKNAVIDLVEYFRSSEYLPKKTMGDAALSLEASTKRTERLPVHIQRVLNLYRIVPI